MDVAEVRPTVTMSDLQNIETAAILGFFETRISRMKKDADQETVVMKTTPVSHVLHRWFTDDEFLDSSGNPRKLEFDGDGVTFSTVVKKYAGDVPPGAMRTELARIEAIDADTEGRVYPVKRIAYNLELHDRLVGGLAGILYPAALNLAHNMAATSSFVRDSDHARLMRISADRIKEFVEAVDDMYGAYEALYDREPKSEDGRAVGVGVFYFEEDRNESKIFF